MNIQMSPQSHRLGLETGLKVPAGRNNDDASVTICYCSNLTSAEIKDAVRDGCRTITDVRKYTGKNITGQCAEKNPEGKCCEKIFLNEIEKGLRL